MIAPLTRLAAGDDRILVGPETADDAGVMRFGDTALVATVDVITPMRNGAADGELEALFRKAVSRKQGRHDMGFTNTRRLQTQMVRIGG